MSNLFDAASTTDQPYQVLLIVALILFLAKTLSILSGKLHMPQVIGFLVAGLLVGLIYLIPQQNLIDGYTSNALAVLAKIGVVMILFSAGLETNIKQIKAVGFASIVITSLGVLVPLILGFLAAYFFKMGDSTVAYAANSQGLTAAEFLNLHPGYNIYSDVYYGVILSATSVSITVATLKELKKLETPEGSAIVSAAILDDVIGIILLSLVISLAGGTGSVTYVSGNVGWNILCILLVMVGFFVLSWVVGFGIRPLFNWLGKKFPRNLMSPIFALVFCFLWSYLAQKFFNIADITGGYVAGLLLSSTISKNDIDDKTESSMDLLFVPIFFAMVAMKVYNASFDWSDLTFIWFGLLWVLAGLAGKIIGAGSGALMCHFSLKDSVRIGIGMMARAEVLIVCAQTGVDSGLVDQKIIPFTLLLILISSFATPIFLKLLYRGEEKQPLADLSARPAAETAPSEGPEKG
jgi:Kef-type K+ transport system membrane component KefB